jgi:hypothetical protein
MWNRFSVCFPPRCAPSFNFTRRPEQHLHSAVSLEALLPFKCAFSELLRREKATCALRPTSATRTRRIRPSATLSANIFYRCASALHILLRGSDWPPRPAVRMRITGDGRGVMGRVTRLRNQRSSQPRAHSRTMNCTLHAVPATAA